MNPSSLLTQQEIDAKKSNSYLGPLKLLRDVEQRRNIDENEIYTQGSCRKDIEE